MSDLATLAPQVAAPPPVIARLVALEAQLRVARRNREMESVLEDLAQRKLDAHGAKRRELDLEIDELEEALSALRALGITPPAEEASDG